MTEFIELSDMAENFIAYAENIGISDNPATIVDVFENWLSTNLEDIVVEVLDSFTNKELKEFYEEWRNV